MDAFKIADVQINEDDFAPASDGKHNCKIVVAEDKANSANTGRYVLVEFKIVGGPDNGKRVRDYCTHKHANPKAVAAGFGRLKRIMQGAGIEEIKDESDLLGLTLSITTEVEELAEDSPYKPQARVRRYEVWDNSLVSGDDSEEVAF